jgi:multidrug efflux pump subunit AcrA (membrane-fusion protein)
VSVEVRPMARDIAAEGPLVEASAVTVTAPFDGRIVRRWVTPGDHVAVGAPLLQLDTSGIEAELRDAQAAQIRAQGELDVLMNWKGSADVTSAQRQVATNLRQMRAAQARLDETQALFDKGIVARLEVDSARSELAGATEQSQSADDALVVALQKGGTPQQRAARLEAESKSTKVRQLQARLDNAVIAAPVAGVVLKPPRSESAPAKDPEVGAFVSKQEVLMAIGDTTQFVVRSALDEFDTARVRTGLPVDVSLSSVEGAVMRGELVRVSSQARTDQRFGASGGAPLFDIEVLIQKVPPELRPRLRLGLTARLRMVFDQQPAAMTVPLAAVRSAASGQATVKRLAAGARDGPGETVQIEPGATLADRIVVARGLTAGDRVWVPQAANVPDIADAVAAETPAAMNFGR